MASPEIPPAARTWSVQNETLNHRYHLSQAVCWIAERNNGMECILHLLDDFVTLEPPTV